MSNFDTNFSDMNERIPRTFSITLQLKMDAFEELVKKYYSTSQIRHNL